MGNSNTSQEKFKSKIGGQALIEGIMMLGPSKGAMACRLPDGTVDLETWDENNGKSAPWYRKVPLVRGCTNFAISLVKGYKYMMKSADKQITEEDKNEVGEPAIEGDATADGASTDAAADEADGASTDAGTSATTDAGAATADAKREFTMDTPREGTSVTDAVEDIVASGSLLFAQVEWPQCEATDGIPVPTTRARTENCNTLHIGDYRFDG